MFMRFQGYKPNPESASMLGIFQLAFELRDRTDLPDYAYQELKKHIDWLRMHLESPAILKEDEHFRAISWFRSDAEAPLEHIWAIKAVLEEFGYHIDLIKTKDPGIVIYEDGWQVVAKPKRK